MLAILPYFQTIYPIFFLIELPLGQADIKSKNSWKSAFLMFDLLFRSVCLRDASLGIELQIYGKTINIQTAF